MGCGCKERGKKAGDRIEAMGFPQAGAAVRRLPHVTDAVGSRLRRVMRTGDPVAEARTPDQTSRDGPKPGGNG